MATAWHPFEILVIPTTVTVVDVEIKTEPWQFAEKNETTAGIECRRLRRTSIAPARTVFGTKPKRPGPTLPKGGTAAVVIFHLDLPTSGRNQDGTRRTITFTFFAFALQL